MAELSTKPVASDSKRLQLGLQLVAVTLSGTPLDTLSRAIRSDDTQCCKIRNGTLGVKIEDAVKLLYAAGLKVVPASKVCVDKAIYESMTTISQKAMANPEFAQTLIWDDEL